MLALLAYNIEQVKPTDALRPLLIALGWRGGAVAGAAAAAAAMLSAAQWWQRSFWCCSSRYGHVYNYLERQAGLRAGARTAPSALAGVDRAGGVGVGMGCQGVT